MYKIIKNYLVLFCLFALLLVSVSSFAKDFGKWRETKENPHSLNEAIQKMDTQNEFFIKAQISQVCQSKGCWMIIEDESKNARVTFKNYSFFVPKDSSKKTALLQGKLYWKTVPVSESRHYAKDAGVSEQEISKITKSEKALWFEASGVKILD